MHIKDVLGVTHKTGSGNPTGIKMITVLLKILHHRVWWLVAKDNN